MIQKNTANKPVALITGAASGLGLALAQQLSTTHFLVLIDIQENALEHAANSLHCSVYFTCDLSERSAIDNLAEKLKKQHLRIDALYNNAGITHRSLASNTHIEVIEKVMRIDYLAPVQLTQVLLPLLTERACIVNIGSMAGWMPVLGRAGYCAAKSALHQYFETLRAEWNNTNKHILMVYPSFLDTPIEHNALNGQGEKATHKRSMVGAVTSSTLMASRIITAAEQRKARLFPDTFTYLSSLLYRLAPSLYLTLMRHRLASELEVTT